MRSSLVIGISGCSFMESAGETTALGQRMINTVPVKVVLTVSMKFKRGSRGDGVSTCKP